MKGAVVAHSISMRLNFKVEMPLIMAGLFDRGSSTGTRKGEMIGVDSTGIFSMAVREGQQMK
jgi:hypothetical protein